MSHNDTQKTNFSFIDAMQLNRTINMLPEILVITTFPPRECGIATYSQDLIYALNNKFKNSFSLLIAAVEENSEHFFYEEEVYAVLNTENPESFLHLAHKCNENESLELILVQHEFGLFKNNEADLIAFLQMVNKPKIIVFHTVLPQPNDQLKQHILDIDNAADAFIVMTKASARILSNDYNIPLHKISIIPHGTHLVEHLDKQMLKIEYGFEGRKILSTFGLLSSGKSIETTLDALPAIIKSQPSILFLIIGKTHPSVVKSEGEAYRMFLADKIEELHLEEHVMFVNQYLSLPVLLKYLQLTDVYLFTSKDRNQAVSGTFAYAISCGCPIISTPIPHASEVLQNETGIIIDFENPKQLATEVIRLLNDLQLQKNISLNGLHKMAPNSWENTAIAHLRLFKKYSNNPIKLVYNIPEINRSHQINMTTDFGIIQFAKINKPELNSGYTLDDNARALVAMCQQYELTTDKLDLAYINLYLDFIKFCQQPNGKFLNYVSIDKKFTAQNNENLDDSNGRAIWALGYLLSISYKLPSATVKIADQLFNKALANVNNIHSTRAMAFIIKGIYLSNYNLNIYTKTKLIKHFANKLVQMYRHESNDNWQWYESYLTYANSILPEAMLYAYLATGDLVYKKIAQNSFRFLLSKTFENNSIKVISNKGWLHNNSLANKPVGGEQPIDIAYTIIALNKFYQVFNQKEFLDKMNSAFNWFLGDNHLHQIIYNPCTGGCYDGLEEDYINLNQGAESTISYLMARLTIEKQKIEALAINELHHNYFPALYPLNGTKVSVEL